MAFVTPRRGRRVVSGSAPRSRVAGRRRPERGGPWGLWERPPLPEGGARALFELAGAWCQGRPWSLAGRADERLFLDYVRGHGLGGLLGELAIGGQVDESTSGEAGRAQYFSNLLNHERALGACRRVVATAADVGVGLSFLKGASLAADVYDDPGLRSYTDLDVLMTSDQEAASLVDALRGPVQGLSARPASLFRRLGHPGRRSVRVEGWEVEVAYPSTRANGPLDALQQRQGARIVRAAPAGQTLPAPEPNVYLVLLVEHLIRHVGERLIWYVDLVALARRYRGEIDWEWVRAELRALGLSALSGHIAGLCARHLDPEFPSLSSGAVGPARPFALSILSEWYVANGFLSQTRRRDPFRRLAAFLLHHLLRVYLLTDADVARSYAASWSAAILLNATGVTRPWCVRAVEWAADWMGRLGLPLAILGARESGPDASRRYGRLDTPGTSV